MPEAYDRWLGPAIFRPFAVDLAARVARYQPSRLLEIAAGSGVLTRELVAASPAGQVTATDLNPAMVSLGAERVPTARWEQADAMRLPFPDGCFDLVVSQFGVMFFPDKPAAFAEARRVLGPGGHLVFNTWDAVGTHDFAAALVAGLDLAFPGDAPTFVVGVPHGYSDRDQVVRDLAAGGLEIVTVESLALEGHAGSAADVAAGFCMGTPLRTAIEARADLTATLAVIAEEMGRRLGPGPVTARMKAYVFEVSSGW